MCVYVFPEASKTICLKRSTPVGFRLFGKELVEHTDWKTEHLMSTDPCTPLVDLVLPFFYSLVETYDVSRKMTLSVSCRAYRRKMCRQNLWYLGTSSTGLQDADQSRPDKLYNNQKESTRRTCV